MKEEGETGRGRGVEKRGRDRSRRLWKGGRRVEGRKEGHCKRWQIKREGGRNAEDKEAERKDSGREREVLNTPEQD